MKRSVVWRMASVAVLITAVMATVVQAQQPTVVVSIRGIAALLDDAEFIGAEIGQTGVKESAETLIGVFTQQKGLAGIDQTKPLGVYVNVTAGGPPAPVVFLPVSDADALQDLVKVFIDDLEVTKGQWKGTAAGTKLFGKVSSGYLFLSTDAAALTKPADPTKIVSGKYDISLDVSLAAIPEPFKAQFLEQVESEGRKGLENGPEPKNEAERVGRDLGFDGTLAVMKAIVNEGDRLTLGIDLDEKTRLGGIDVSITGKSNSGMAKAMTAYGKIQPAFAGIGSEAAPVRVVISYPTTGFTEQLDAVFKALRSSADQEIAKDERLTEDKDKATAKKMASRLFDIAQATIKAGSLHSGFVLEDGGEGKIRMLGATRVAQGDDVSKLMDDAIKASKGSPELDKLKLDVAKQGGARIHAVTPELDDDTEKYLGDEPIHFAIRTDSLWFSAGGGNLVSLKKALDQKPATRTVGSPVSIQIKPAALVLLMEKDNEDLIERAKEIAGKPSDKASLDLAPIANGVKLRIEFGIDLLKLAKND